MIKSKKYTGIYFNELENNDKAFYFTYIDILTKKKVWVNVGKYTEGMRENTAFTLRNEQLSKMKHGKDINIISNKKKKDIITYDNLANIYFADKKVKEERISRYNLYIKSVFGNMDINNITKQKIKDFLESISKLGKANQTVNGLRELFSAIINHNIKERELKYINPCIGIPRLKIDNDRERYLTIEEIKLLKDELKGKFLVNLFLDLSLQTGGRFETILSIQKKDINLSTGSVTLKNLKTKNTYTGFLQDDLIESIRAYLDTLKINDYVISYENEHHIKLTQRQMQHRLKPKIDKLFNEGLNSRDSKNRVVIHSLRHTFASHLAINGVPIFTIQKLMDHKKIEQTIRYAKLSPENGRNAVKTLYQGI